MTLIWADNFEDFEGRPVESPLHYSEYGEPRGFHRYLNEPLKVRLARYRLSKVITAEALERPKNESANWSK